MGAINGIVMGVYAVVIDIRILFFLHIMRTNRHIETQFCIHIIIDKI